MKTKPVPTSPKVQKKEKVVNDIYSESDSKSFDKPPVKQRIGLVVIVLAIILGFLAGLLGEVIISSLAVSYPNLPIISDLYLNRYADGNKIIIQRSEKSLTALEFEIQETLKETRPVVVSIFQKKEINKQSPLNQIYGQDSKIGNGIILTNDGLVATTDQVIEDATLDYVALTHDRAVYSIKNVQEDPASDAVFFKISADNLNVAEFIDQADLKIGQQLMSVANKVIHSSFGENFADNGIP